MKKIFKTITYLTMIILLVGMFSINISGKVAYGEESQKPTVFMISPTFVSSTENGTYVYDSTDKCLKKIEQNASDSESYYVGDVIDMCHFDTKIILLKSNGIAIFETESNELSDTTMLDWMNEFYCHIDLSVVNGTPILSIYGSSTINEDNQLLPIKTTIWANDLSFYDVTIESSDTSIKLVSYAYLDGQAYLVKSSETSIYFFPLTIGENTNLNTSTQIREITEDSAADIVKLICLDETMVITYSQITTSYLLDKTSSNITATIDQSVSHTYQEEAIFDAIDTTKHDNNFIILSNDSYYILDLSNFAFVDKRSNATCEEHYYQDKSALKYYRVTTESQLISTLGNAEFTQINAGEYVVEIASSTIVGGSDLIGYKFVVYPHLEQGGLYSNHYGYIKDDYNLEHIEFESGTTLERVANNTKVYAYPSVCEDQSDDEHNNHVIFIADSQMIVNCLSKLGEYQTGVEGSYTSYALVDINGHIGFIDQRNILSGDKRIINTMPNAKIIAETPVYEQANKNSSIIYNLEKGKDVRIVGTRDRNGFIKIAFNTDDGKYYEGYIMAANVRANSYTTMQTIGAVLVILNVILLSILIATRKKIIK